MHAPYEFLERLVRSFFFSCAIPFRADGDGPSGRGRAGPFAMHATRGGRVLLRAKGQPRAVNRAFSGRWQHAVIHLRAHTRGLLA